MKFSPVTYKGINDLGIGWGDHPARLTAKKQLSLDCRSSHPTCAQMSKLSRAIAYLRPKPVGTSLTLKTLPLEAVWRLGY